MPFYDFWCENCKKKFEEKRNMTDNSEVNCPSCKKTAKRLISGGITVVYKGTGFYSTDYAGKI